MASKQLNARDSFTQAIQIYETKKPGSIELALVQERYAMFLFRRDKYAESERLLSKYVLYIC